MYTRLQVALWAALAAVGLFLSDGMAVSQPTRTTTSNAQTTKKGTAKKATTQNHHASVIAELHHAKHLLDIALHDYHGHRAHADHEVSKAIHLLEHGHHHKGEHHTSFKTPVHQGEASGETQQQSDSRLRHAQKLVNAAHLQLNSKQSKNGQHHHKEVAHLLTKASHEIDLALAVVHHYHHHHKKAQQVAVAGIAGGALVPAAR